MQQRPPRIDTITGWLLAATALLLALLGACPAAHANGNTQSTQATLGMHLHTVHFGGQGLTDSTPGLYLQARSGPLAGASVGAYRNSYGNASFYAAYTWQTPGRWAALTVGGVTGYDTATVAPMLVPSLRLPLQGPAALRLAYLPKAFKHGAAGLHLSIETDL